MKQEVDSKRKVMHVEMSGALTTARAKRVLDLLYPRRRRRGIIK